MAVFSLNSRPCVFLGGPMDGQRLHVQEGQARFQFVDAGPPPRVHDDLPVSVAARIVMYRREILMAGAEASPVFLAEGLSLRDGLLKLLRGYKPERENRLVLGWAEEAEQG